MQISAENLQEELDLRHVENRQIKKELEKLIQDYKPEKTASTDVTRRIILKDEEPVYQTPRRLAFTERKEVNKQIEEWLNEGIIRPSSSEYASPILMVKKKDGSSRMCIDYRKLNEKLVKDKFPLPLIEDVLDTLREAKLSLDDSTKWFKYVDRLQRILNSTITVRRNGERIARKREFLRNDAKKNIETLQSENRKTYNRRRKKASLYKEGNLVAIQRTQFGAGLKLGPKFLGPYKVTKVKRTIHVKFVYYRIPKQRRLTEVNKMALQAQSQIESNELTLSKLKRKRGTLRGVVTKQITKLESDILIPNIAVEDLEESFQLLT
ncbi:retrovirus-related Pol polyprotein from transposon 412 [Trichonephila clavipes]|nr:retrovirus-related Pol polyprotein from transposon 412 [Trichonephila clavipes]